MKKFLLAPAALALAGALLPSPVRAAQENAGRPNVVVVLADDAGWGDYGITAAWLVWALSSFWYLTRGDALLGVATAVVNGLLAALAHALAAAAPDLCHHGVEGLLGPRHQEDARSVAGQSAGDRPADPA